MESLKGLFKPQSVVVVGASHDQGKLGYGVARNLIHSGFGGEIYFINPKGGELFGKKILASFDELKNEIDLAIIVVHASRVPELLIACSQKGIKNIIVLTSGFKESGQEGARLEEKCKKIINDKGLRVLGPNCIGIIDTHLPLDTTFIPPPLPDKGDIALVTQSGALGAAVIDWARGDGTGISKLISLGNQIDVDESDALMVTAESPYTKAIMLYLESVQDGSKFVKFAQNASSKKPIVALKGGVSDAGEKAAISHTGALAGSDAAYEAAFRKAGILRARTIKEMFDWAKLLSNTCEPKDNRIAILSNAGGPGVIATDFVEKNGLRMANLSAKTRENLSSFLPEAASILNPVDMLASASPEIYTESLRILLEDPNVDMVLVIAPPPPMYPASQIADHLVDLIKSSTKPVVVAFMGSILVKEAKDIMRENNIPVFSFPEEAIAGLGALWNHKLLKSQDLKIIQPTQYLDRVDSHNRISENKYIPTLSSAENTEKILERYHIPLLKLYPAADEESAIKVASKIGYPIVMKISMDGLSHKTDIGGILLDLRSDSEVREGYKKLKIKAQTQSRYGEFNGVYIQKMLKSGQEIVIGAIRDPIFGPLVMFGSGGVDIEGLRDVKFSLAPITYGDFQYFLLNTWAGRKLRGFRNQQEMDIDAVRDCIAKISQLIVENPEITEIELNPVIVGENGAGINAVDARMVVNPIH